jgi:cytochrome c
MNRILIGVIAASSVTIAAQAVFAADGNAARGQRVFGACAACHSLQPDKNMTGPSLSGVFGRKAGTSESFPRYSAPLKSSGVTWNEDTLDQWIADPQKVIPGNQMTFPGIKDARQRSDLLAFLKEATKPGQAPSFQSAQSGSMGGMMGGGTVPNLKKLEPDERVQKILYCRDTYRVTTADGQTRNFWERNLRLKTDSTADGPQKGAPAVIGAGMMGDRADVIFAAPEEISGFILSQCE